MPTSDTPGDQAEARELAERAPGTRHPGAARRNCLQRRLRRRWRGAGALFLEELDGWRPPMAVPGKEEKERLVEAVGIEPTSEKPDPRAPTCVSFFLFLAALHLEEGIPAAWPAPRILECRRETASASRTHLNDAPAVVVDQGDPPARATLFKPRERSCRWQLSRVPFVERKLGTLPTNRDVPRRNQCAPLCQPLLLSKTLVRGPRPRTLSSRYNTDPAVRIPVLPSTPAYTKGPVRVLAPLRSRQRS
jgi:hypothetical protein